MDSKEIYDHIKRELAEHLTELQQAVLMHEVELYREKIGHNLKTDVTQWITAVCKSFDVEVDALAVRSRRIELLRPRQVIMWGLLTGIVPNKLTLGAVGKIFHRDHATASHSKRMINDLLDTDPELRETVMQLINKFGWRANYDTVEKKFSIRHSVYLVRGAA